MLRSFQFWRTLLVSKQSKPLQSSKVTDRGLAMFCSWKSEQYKDHFEAGKIFNPTSTRIRVCFHQDIVLIVVVNALKVSPLPVLVPTKANIYYLT